MWVCDWFYIFKWFLKCSVTCIPSKIGMMAQSYNLDLDLDYTCLVFQSLKILRLLHNVMKGGGSLFKYYPAHKIQKYI